MDWGFFCSDALSAPTMIMIKTTRSQQFLEKGEKFHHASGAQLGFFIVLKETELVPEPEFSWLWAGSFNELVCFSTDTKPSQCCISTSSKAFQSNCTHRGDMNRKPDKRQILTTEFFIILSVLPHYIYIAYCNDGELLYLFSAALIVHGGGTVEKLRDTRFSLSLFEFGVCLCLLVQSLSFL